MALTGLFVGLSVGLLVLIFKHWLTNEIVDSLEDEVHAACDCSLAFDSFSLSFSRLGGRARNVRIMEHGVAKLSFKEITAKVNLKEIRERKIHLTKVRLTNATADGVGPDSVAFRFIDQLTTPLPPDKQRPDRWRVILDSLEVEDSFLREPFSTSEISGSGVSLVVNRIGENFELAPRIKDFRYTSYGVTPGSPPAEVFLGSLAGTVVIEDSKTTFKTLTLGDGESVVKARADLDTDHDNQLAGEASYSMTPGYIGLPEWLRGIFTGSSVISGLIESPLITGDLLSSSSAPMTLSFPHASEVSLSAMKAGLSIDINHGSPIVTLSDIQGSSPNTSLRGTQPLVFSDRGLSAGFEATLPHFSYGPFTIKDGNARISISQEKVGIVTHLVVVTQDAQLQGVSMGPMEIEVNISPSAVDVKASSNSPLQGSLGWQGSIDLTGPEPLLRSGLLTLKSFRYPTSVPISPETLAPIAITTSFSLKGPLDLAQLKGDGETTVSFPAIASALPLSGSSSLKDGLLKVTLPNSSYGGSAELNVDFTGTRGGKLVAKLPPQQAKKFLADDGECGTIGGALSYSFQLTAPLNGTGELSLNDFSLGCPPYALTIPARTTIPIKAGALNFKDLTVSSLDSTLTLNGEVGIAKGLDLSAKGRLQLSSLIPLLPSIDDIQGGLRADMTIKGPLSSPSFNGNAELTDGEFGLSSPDVGAHNVRGKFTMTGSHVRIETLSGSVNNGTFSVKGSLLPFDLANSELTADLKEVTIEPVQDSSITFSGELRLGLGPTKRQMLAGDILINFAEVSKDFDLNKILINAISGYFLPARVQPITAKKKVDIDLDVNLSAPRNIFVLTPFFSAELDTNLRAGGTISDPSLIGSMQVLSGWVGLKGNRFDITSGAVTFKPGSLVPTIELASEGTLRAPTGDSVLVILDASGPLPNPKIELSSDRGLSQGELLLLLTSSRRLGGSTEANRLGGQLGSDQRFFMNDDSFSSLRAFWRNLTRIDTLSFEPAYNQFTGTIEPAVIARKNLSPRLALLGESLFSSVSNSRAGAVYNLTPKLNVNAFFQTVSTQRNSILSSDLTYTVLSEQAEFVTFVIEGLSNFSEENILSAARLGAASRVLNTPDGLRSIERQILNYMFDQGYRDASLQVRCERGERYCNELRIVVSEGTPSIIASIIFEGDKLTDDLQKLVRDLAPLGSPATATIANTIEQKTVIALRSDGYISARITPTYKVSDKSGHTTLVISADIREPISFIFSGNKVFKGEDFLNSIDLFSRKRAFGNNTIKLLTQNIEQMYQERGYLFVNVSYIEDRSDPTRLVYHIQIREEAPTRVGTLTLSGNSHLSRARIIQIMTEIGLGEQARLFEPTYAVPAELDTLRDAITTVYQEEGFPQVAVTYAVSPIASEDRLSVDFTITEGSPVRASKLIVEGYPRELAIMSLPATPISVPRVNAYAEQVIENIRNEGYLFPSIILEPSEDLSTITVTIEPGARTTVSSVSYEGLLTIAEKTAQKATVLKAGAPYRAEDVNQTKRNLLRTGLFSRVEVLANDNNFDTPSEAVIIRLVERPLETLEVGGGANSEFGLHTFGEAVNKSYFADGRTLSLRVDTYFDQGFINPNGSGLISQGFTSARYQDPTFLDSEYSLTEEVRYQRQELSTQEFNLDRLLFGSYLFRRYDSGITLSAGHSLVFDNLQDVTPGAIISDLDDGSVRLSFLSSVMRLDRRDDSILPRSGYTLNLEPKLSLVGIGSQANFASLIARSTAIVPLSFVSPRYTLGLGLSGGLSQPWGDTTEIPITQRFYLGGRTTVRGFRENSLGPRGSDGAVIGGDTMLASKTELQYLVADSFSTHIFLDAGNIFLRHEDFDLADIRTSTGIGFQYLSPIGPIGFDVGHPLDERSGEPSVRLHFSVGSMF